ncbi:MAG: hypothetical protein Q7R65_04525 [bacterium]|nr:hypothetical protein [bacterium]
MASLKIVTLNLSRGFPGIEKSMSFLSRPEWDMACLQDVQVTHLPRLAEIFPGAQYFAPMTKHLIDGVRVPVGIGIFSRGEPFISPSAHAYVGNVLPVLDLDGVEISADGNAEPVDLSRVRATESRLAVFVGVSVGGRYFKIGTTHGTWSPAKYIPDNHQRWSIFKLVGIIDEQRPDVMAGDFNAPRGGELYNILCNRSLIDRVPTSIVNSIDWKLRGRSGPDVLVDYFFTATASDISDVQTHFGVSDHAALSGTVSKI